MTSTSDAPGLPIVGNPYTGRNARFSMFAEVYEAAGQRGIPPEVVDRTEVWKVAAMLGLDYERHPVEEDRPRSDGRAGVVSRPRRNLVAERMRHAQGLGPKPEPDEPDPASSALAMQLAGRMTR